MGTELGEVEGMNKYEARTKYWLLLAYIATGFSSLGAEGWGIVALFMVAASCYSLVDEIRKAPEIQP